MTRKQLPKAIRRTDADLHLVSSGPDMEAPPPQRAAHTVHPLDTELEGEILLPAANDQLPVAAGSQLEAEERLRKAFRIVERHQMFSGLGGLFPIAAVNVVSVTAANLRMVKRLSDLYGVSFEQEKARSMIIGLMGGAAPAGLAAATATTLFHVIPAAGAIGMAVSSVAAATLTRRIGMSYVERFEASTFG
ncbi:MAG: DUF697 domain-containing protein [Pseudorhodoplanes sp.]